MTILLNGKKKPLIDKWNNPKYQSFAAAAYHHAEHVSRVPFAAFDIGGYGKGEDYTLIDIDHVCASTTRKFTNSIPKRQKSKKSETFRILKPVTPRNVLTP